MNKKAILWGTLGVGALAAAVVAAQKQTYSPATHPNPHAPAQTDQTILVHTTPERVWQVLSQISRWPDWQPDIPAARLHGPVQPGSSLPDEVLPEFVEMLYQHNLPYVFDSQKFERQFFAATPYAEGIQRATAGGR
ncbi:hypothetical protein QMK33_21850 [Hymenobacter sp. H14-R3]|uniref:hypothetical protein n=1 Tax=Hymenobacter sp. H14-R3 TaxID=3046308 RepID=UPI0024BBD103|nr:hypothetical protein [Hymenobacter sp. H14-R3]MDJ0367799.1 hypothetical protein [Hymenobacter sp. H14-R3]